MFNANVSDEKEFFTQQKVRKFKKRPYKTKNIEKKLQKYRIYQSYFDNHKEHEQCQEQKRWICC